MPPPAIDVTRRKERRSRREVSIKTSWGAGVTILAPRKPSRASERLGPLLEVRERDEVADGILYADLAGAVKRGPLRQVNVHAADCSFDGLQVVNLQVQKGRPLADVGGDRWQILIHAG